MELRRLASLAIITAVALAAGVAAALPSADEILTDVGFPAGDRQNVLGGQFVTTDLPNVSSRDLSVAIAFLMKAPPASVSDEIMAGKLIGSDTQVRAHGDLTAGSTAADLAALPMADDTAKAFAGASAGESLNLSTSEIAAFNALQGAGTQAVKQQLQKMLLARFQSYKSSGLAGIPTYDRGGSSSDPAADLRRAGEAANGLKKYLPAFQQVLLDYPKATVPGMSEDFRWLTYDESGKTNYVLTHMMAVADGEARVVAQRQFYVSTGYNAEQAVIALWPVTEGTLAVYTNHTFTDQVAGFGGSMKRSIGRSMMEKQLEKMFSKAQGMVK